MRGIKLNSCQEKAAPAVKFLDRCINVTEQERIYQATRIVEGVALCLLDYAQCDSELDRFDAAELAGRLEIAVGAIRTLNGGLG